MGNQPFDCKKGHSITVFQACQRDISVTLYIFDAYRVIAAFPAWTGIISLTRFYRQAPQI